MCVPHEHTQTDADRLQKLERHTREHTKRNKHTLCVLFVLCQVRRLSLLFNSREEGELDASYTDTHSTSFPDTLSLQQKHGTRKESLLNEINREIIP